MKNLAIAVIVFALSQNGKLVNTVWEDKVASQCVNKYIFKSASRVDDYNCELNYTFKCTYAINKDTLLIVEKDDSHSEDGGKATYYRMRYLITKNLLCRISNGKLVKGKWIDKQYKIDLKDGFRRVK
jgi:hypothetical protein